MASLRIPSPRRGLVARLAIADLRWDSLMTACVVSSLAATIAPLIILFALKSGVVESLRADLVEDPVFRAIIPAETMLYDEAFFDRIAQREDVAFIVPGVTRGASAVMAEHAGERAILDMLPTAPGDSLLQAYGVEAPQPGCVVVTEETIERLGGADALSAGDTITLETSRRSGGREEVVREQACISGVLPPRADTLPRVYVPLDLAVDIERFREGGAIPDRGWPGSIAYIEPRYDGVLVRTARSVSAVERARLATATGFVIVEETDTERFAELAAAPAPPGGPWLDLRVVDQSTDSAAPDRVRGQLRSASPTLFPYVEGLQVTGPDGASVPLLLRDFERREDVAGALSEVAEIVAPASWNAAVGEIVNLRLEGAPTNVTVPATVAAVHDRNAVAAPLALAALLRSATERPAAYVEERGGLVAVQTGFRGFRIFARSIDDVPELAAALEAQGVPVIAQIQAIERIRVFDSGLSALFWIIAAIAGVGAGVAAVANLYGSVERKRAALGHLRLLGLRKSAVAFFPVYQGAVIAVLSSAMAFGFALAGAAIINNGAGPQLGFERQAALLEYEVGLISAALALAAGLVASTLAAMRTMSIDPAEAIRNE